MPFRTFKLSLSKNKLLSNSLFKNSIIYTLTDAVNKAIPFLLLPILTHYLLPEEYGIASNYNVYVSILLIFIGLSFQAAISVNYYKLDRKQLAIYISNVAMMIFAAFFLILILTFLFHNNLASLLHIPLIYVIAGTVIAMAQAFTAINLALWQLEENALKYGVYEITQTALNIGLSLFFIISLHARWEGRINGFLIASILYGLFSILFIYMRGYLNFNVNKKYIKDALVFSLPLLPHSLSIWIRSGIDRIYISKLLNEAQTGIYATGFQFGLLVSFVTMAFNNAYVPYLYRNLSIENPETLKLVKIKLVKFTYIYMVLLFIGGVVLTFLSFFLVDHLLSVKYSKVKAFIPWAILAQIFQGMYLMVVNYVFFAKKTTKLAYITFACALGQVILSYIFIKQFGAIGAAYSTTIISFINFIAVWIYSQRVLSMPWWRLKN